MTYNKVCCVTGHRNIPLEKTTFVKEKLKEEIEKAVSDGFTTFISGFAGGVDLLFAELVIEQQIQNPYLLLEAALPYRNRLNTKDSLFHKCIKACSTIHIQQELYSPNCFMQRNRFMVSLSSRVIAVYDGREHGGTLYTMRYACTSKREVHEIQI